MRKKKKYLKTVISRDKAFNNLNKKKKLDESKINNIKPQKKKKASNIAMEPCSESHKSR